MKASVIGLGLIGGSFALALKEAGLCTQVCGADMSEAHCRKALELGLVEQTAAWEDAIADAELIVLATPVDTIPVLAVQILNRIGDRQVVMDMGSIKENLCEVIARHPKRGRFVATHPMWGTEHSGPEAACRGAFRGRTAVICEEARSDADALATVRNIYTALGMPVISMNAADHDLHAAYVSHISHISSFALALTVLEKEREEAHIFDLAGGGFESTVRLAKSSPATWAPIFTGNKDHVLDVLREHIHQLQALQRMLERDDREGLISAMERANTIRRILP